MMESKRIGRLSIILPLAIFLSFIFTNSFGQNQYKHWHFGIGAAVDFTGTVPTAPTTSVLYANEGCSSIADNNGNLLFYTNGRNVYNASHIMMPNGNGLLSSNSSTQGALIVQDPANAAQYFIFTVADVSSSSCGCFTYSVVDMTLEGGMGDVTAVKNVVLHNNTSEKLSAIKNMNGETWIMIHERITNNFRAYLLNSSGTIDPPVVSSVGSVYDLDAIGQMKFSPSCDKIASILYSSGKFEMYDFDIATGMVSNPSLSPLIASGSELYGLEFSPDGSKIYASSLRTVFGGTGYIYQFDVNAGSPAAIFASKIIVNLMNTTYYGALQLAPDNKIYIVQNSIPYLHAITDPNLPGVACGYQDSLIDLNGRSAYYGLPSFVTLPAHITPLPIELLSFTGESLGDKNKLSWTTASEMNNDYFTLEKSSDEQIFEALAIIEGAGNSATILNYSFVDTDPFNSINYYRLKQTDFDGSTKLSSTIALNSVSGNEFSIFPNSSSSALHIQLYNSQTALIKIIDELGRIHKQAQIYNGENIVDLAALSNGIYFVTLITDRLQASKKFILSH
ncbi:MAG: T9SS type A sorting domain-containing protein [Bacteroidota bacterium]|nr:T9SS type A sorting domain-containing protein [Bacteroidota bacterium]